MFIPVGLALGALSTVSSLVESAASSLAKSGGNNPLSALAQAFTGEQPAATAGATPAAAKFDSGTLAALISLQGQGTAGASGGQGLFAKLDADGDGAISKSEFETALKGAGADSTGADALFAKLDANGDGAISKNELAAPQSAYQSHHRHHHAGGAGQGGASSLLDATSADGSTSQTTTNADGSTTTTVTYADGSTVSTTMPVSSQSGGGNPLEQLIRLQAMLASPATTSTVAVA